MSSGKIKLGIVGACGRGSSFKAACDAHPDVEIAAVCDLDEKGLEEARMRLGASLKYTDCLRPCPSTRAVIWSWRPENRAEST
jgi:predicted dehydrogenase